MLEKLGYNVVGKSDSLEALDVFRAKPDAFDLVITDQTMPKMTGDKLAESILRIRPDLPVILCTGFSEVIDADEAKVLGIREFVMKPFTVREMAEKVRKALGK
jgi:DNA-binding NtrC family response regulator